MTRLLVLGIFAIAIARCFAQANPIDQIEPGEWYEVPNSTLISVAPSPEPPGYSGVASVIGAWCGAAFDTKRNRLIIWGGGHSDYAGNEVYVFDLNTLEWIRIWGPTPNNLIPEGSTFEVYNDGNPSARHTYSGLTYIPEPYDVLFSQGGSVWQSGYETDATWWFDLDQFEWIRRDDAPSTTLGVVCVYDPVSQSVIHRGRYEINLYNPVENDYTLLADNNTGGWWSDRTSAAIDPNRRLMVFISDEGFELFNLETHRIFSPKTSGDNEIEIADAPGLTYDPISDKIVAWCGDPQAGFRAQDVYVLDLDNMNWTKVEPSVTNTTIPSNVSAAGGTYGRFQYVPSKNVFILVNSADENVYVYRLSDVNYVDTETVSSPGTYQFNESADGHTVEIVLSSLTGSGNITVQQTNEAPYDAPGIDECNYKYDIIKDAGITAFTADLTFNYSDTDVEGFTETSAYLGIAKFNSTTNTWIWLGGTINSAENKITVTGLTSFSKFAIYRRLFGDINGDGYVDAADLQRLGDVWHQINSGEFDPGTDTRFFNYNKNASAGSQIIDAADLQVFGDCWHNGIEPLGKIIGTPDVNPKNGSKTRKGEQSP